MTTQTASDTGTTDQPVLSLRNLGKRFPGQVALADVDLDLAAGEIHALIGENGSGKSTLIKCLAGVHTPEPGTVIAVDGTPLPPGYRQQDAGRHGLTFVHQDLGLVPTLTVLENLALWRGFSTRGQVAVDWRAERRRAREVLGRFDVDVDPDAMVQHLSVTAQTEVAIARSLEDARRGGRVLVLDEPTAALPDVEADKLFSHLERLAADGLAILYVSHRLEEIFRLASRVTILRDGRHVVTTDLDGMTQHQLVALLVGQELTQLHLGRPVSHTHDESDAYTVELRGVTGSSVSDVSFGIRPGEVVGIAGLAGSGRSEIARLIAGAEPVRAGQILIDGNPVAFGQPTDAIGCGIAYIPQDRRGAAVILSQTVARNSTLPSLKSLTARGVINRRHERELAGRLVADFNIRPADPGRVVATLSGGNQQKVVLAKWLHRQPRVLVLDEPVQGIDVGAKAEVFDFIDKAVNEGAAALLIDSEFDNLTRLCERVLVLWHGRVVHQLAGPAVSRDAILSQVFATQGAA